MTWKETTRMDQKLEFVLKAKSREMPFRELCRQFGISHKTGYKWVNRFAEGGLAALCDQSTRPQFSPASLSEDIVCKIVALKNAHPFWGPRKIRLIYARTHPPALTPSESSFKRVLEKAGLVKKCVRRPASECGRPQLRRQAKLPNEVWTVDFKGWWRVIDGRRCEPLTIRDAFSRYILCADPLPNTDTKSARACFEETFRRYGLPETIRSDNGTPFASSNAMLGLSRLSVWWLALGISLDRIDPGRPDQNGAHERMHRDIAIEVQATAQGTLEEQRAALSVWREMYNEVRPHEGIGNRTPAELYRPSPRRYEGTPEKLAYPPGYLERRVQPCGMIKLENKNIFISSALDGWNVGLLPESGEWLGVWFGALRLGTIDLAASSFNAAAPTVEMPPCGQPVET